MSSLINVSMNLQNLPKEKFVEGKKGVYYNFTISVNDETNQFGQNVSLFDSQTKEERETKTEKVYLGNVQVVWTNDQNVNPAPKQETAAPVAPVAQPAAAETIVDDLPF